MKKLQKLRYLRVDDKPPRPNRDIVRELPVEIKDLAEWFEFCQRVAKGEAWEYELLTIDFNFKDDRSGPWFPFPDQDPKIYNADFLNDPLLSQLGWSHRLSDIGPNSGLLIGAFLVSYAAHRDLPCGVGFHTYHLNMIIRDMSSAMLAAEILLASGAPLAVESLGGLLRGTIDIVQEASGRPQVFALADAAARFRQAFLRRAGAGDLPGEDSVRLWMEPSSLWNLLDIFREAQTEEGLNRQLERFGLEFYDRDGKHNSLDLRSMLIDRLLYDDGVPSVRPHLPLADVKPLVDDRPEPGVVWQFIETLAIRTPSNVGPVMEYFRRFKSGKPTGTINEAVKRKVHRLIALIFAWLDQYAERWLSAQSEPWNPFEEEFGGDMPTMTEQVTDLLRAMARAGEKGWFVADAQDKDVKVAFNPHVHFLPLSSKDERSISAVVREHSVRGLPLYKALRFNAPEQAGLGQRRLTALARIVAVAVRWGNLTEESDADGKGVDCYRLNRMELLPQRPIKTVQADLAQRLGFDVEVDEDASTQLKRIIQGTPGFEKMSVKDFQSMLEERPLADHLKWLGWEFMEEFWRPPNPVYLPYEAWPVCLSEGKGEAGAMSLVEWRRKLKRSQEAARQIQSAIMPSPLRLPEGESEIWCWRSSAEEVGGDYYHVKKGEHGTHHLYIGDVCGNGLPAALLVQELHGLVKVLEERRLPPEEICAQLDRQLYERGFDYAEPDINAAAEVNGRWATFVCATLDFESLCLTYANAGHEPPLIIREDGSVTPLMSQSRPLALIPGGDYRSETVKLARGDRLLFFTDGLSEVLEDELLQCAVANRRLSASELGKALTEKAKSAGRQADDMTLVTVSIN